MRSLIGILILSVNVLVGGFALAEPPSSRFTSVFKTETGTTGLASSDVSMISTRTSSVDLDSGSWLSTAQFRCGFDRVDPDYSRYLITEKNGTVHALSTQYRGSESVLRAGVDIYLKDYSFSFEGSNTQSAAPFPGSNAKLSVAFESPVYGSKYSVGFARQDHRTPLSFFVDPDTFQTRLRPERSLENRLSAAVEQILSEDAKLKAEIFAADRPESRPSTQGLDLSSAVAVNSRSSVVLKVGGAHETRSASLLDERGYLDATWGQAEYRLEPSYRWSISGVVGTILETESARGRFSFQKVGTDSIGFETRTRGRAWEFGVKALGSFANTGYQSIEFSGDLAWQI